MKKLLALTLTLASFGFVATSAEAKPSPSLTSPATVAAIRAAAPQERNRIRRWRGMRRARIVTRLVHRGRQIYRETYRVTYLPNGSTRTRLVSRVRVR